MITKKRTNKEIVVNCADHVFTLKPRLRYLGVQIDMKMRFFEHAEVVSEKTAIVAKQLGYITL